MQEKPDFNSFYKSELAPKLDELEKLRRGKLKNVINSVAIGITGLLTGILTLFPLIGVLIAVGGNIVYWIWYRHNTDGYKEKFKTGVIREIVKYHDPNLEYYYNQGMSQAAFVGCKIWPNPDVYRSDDLVSGKVDKTLITFSEVHAQEKHRDSKGRTHYTTTFKGIFFSADFNKHFNGYTLVLPDFAEKNLGFLGKMIQKLNFSRPDLVKLEHPEFEKHFVVYSDDQVEARYILSTTLVERILNFKKKTNQKIYLSFINSTVYVGIYDSKNLFEAPLWKSILNFDLIETYHEDMELALSIVEELNLNRRIWTKE